MCQHFPLTILSRFFHFLFIEYLLISVIQVYSLFFIPNSVYQPLHPVISVLWWWLDRQDQRQPRVKPSNQREPTNGMIHKIKLPLNTPAPLYSWSISIFLTQKPVSCFSHIFQRFSVKSKCYILNSDIYLWIQFLPVRLFSVLIG